MAPKLSIVPSQMTARDAVDAFDGIAKEISSRCEIYVSLNRLTYSRPEMPLHASVYAEGMCGVGRELTFSVEAESFDGLASAVRTKWSEFSEEHGRRAVKAMALEVIRLTDEMGQCTDAALRVGKFTADDVERYGAQACAKAAEMASKGPFTIVSLGGANRGEDAA